MTATQTNGHSVATLLDQWLQTHSMGRRPRTIEFNEGIIELIRTHWPNLDQHAETVTLDEVLAFWKKIPAYCSSRWNAICSVLRFVTPHAAHLRKKGIKFRDFVPPTKEELARFLGELDHNARSNARLTVRFLILTGMRMNEARNLTWDRVFPDRIEVIAEHSKNGKRRSIPILPGLQPVLEELRKSKPWRSMAKADKAHWRKNYVFKDMEFRGAVRTACRRVGMKKLSPHCFRHIFATKMIELGMDVPTVARLLGHSDGGALLARMYFHLATEHMNTQMQKAAAFSLSI